MENSNGLSPIVQTVILAFTAFVLVLIILTRVDTFIRQKGIDDCGRVARYEYTSPDGTVKTLSPMTEAYQACLREKGIRK